VEREPRSPVAPDDHVPARELAALGGLSVAALRSQVRVAYAKVAEFQARGAVHVHAVIRLDGPDGPDTAPAGGATAQRLAEAVARTAARVAVTVKDPTVASS